MPDMEQQYLDRLEVGDREKETVTYREYYEGDHSTQLTKRQMRYLQLKQGEEFRGNYCPIVVDALVFPSGNSRSCST